MPLLIVFLIWYGLFGSNNPRIYNRIADKLPKIIFGFILLSIFSSLIPSIIGLSIGLLVMASPFLFLVWLARLSTRGRKRQQKSDYEYYRTHYQEDTSRKKGTTVTGLTRSVGKRRKIVNKFNKKHGLNLTDAEVTRIVDASYMSNCWEREIYDMDQEMDSLFEWYKGDTAWLRAYLHAFPVQNVTSDFEAQRTVCLSTFNQVFREIDPGRFVTIDDCVNAINNRFFTNFDETTFMVAYRFLERHGYHYDLPHMDILKSTMDIDSLKDKYDREYAATDTRGRYETRRM
ncbi:MAG: hypothetical protein ACI4EK_08745 [Wujia sp.]